MRVLSVILAFCLWASAQNQVAPMLNLVVVEGDGAINNIRQRTAREPIIQVQDENHKPVAGAIVTFTLPERGAGGSFANGAHTLTVTTNPQGQAVAHGFHPNAVRGQFQIRVNANYQGRSGNTTIRQTNAVLTAAGTIAGSAISGKLIALLVVLGAAAAGGAVYATHNGGSSTSTIAANPSTTVTAGSGTVGPPR
ncbi:MAG: hypothetical protein KGN36_19030 [Acidobacteriota bacterium]|nr:hypothetical protein [Acidobacteriota bacterium]